MTRPTSPSRFGIAAFLSTVLLTGQFAPYGFALAAPQPFARGGAGVSRLPLGVLAFDAPSFGMVSDAINLASGNVYVDAFAATHNNALSSKDDTQNFFADWNLAPKLRLEGFSRAWATAPDGLSIASGDSSRISFRKVERSTLDFSTLPTWIARYRGSATTVLYRSRQEAASQSQENWLALTSTSGGYVAHLYETDGTRVTFQNDGEFADYVQNPSQQYRSAKLNDPDGVSATSPKTEFTYADITQGRLGELRDEYGRVTRLTWNATTGTLTELQQLVSSNKASGANRVAFQYQTLNGQQVLQQVTYTAQSGAGQESSRWIRFEYTASGPRLMVTKLSRQALDSTSSVDTGYAYDSQNRLTRVTETGQPDTTYAYTSDATGQTVTVTQDSKVDTYRFNIYTQLNWRTQRDLQPSKPETLLKWTYTYDEAGRTRSVVTPTGSATLLTYDIRGNITRLDEFDKAPTIDATPTPADPANPDAQAVPTPPPPTSTTPISFKVTITTRPNTLRSGQTCQFTAALQAEGSGALPNDRSVVWSAQLGKINANTGLYTAPDKGFSSGGSKPTFDTVTATAKADSKVSDSLKFKVDLVGQKCAATPPTSQPQTTQAQTATLNAQATRLTTQEVGIVQTGDRASVFTYDRDNRLLTQVTPGQSGTRDGTPYQSGEVKEERTYTDVTTTSQVQTFSLLNQLTSVLTLGGQEQRRTVTAFDESARATEVTSTVDGLSETHRLTYADGTTAQVAAPNTDGTPGSTRPVPQYGDLIKTVTRDDGFTTGYQYDEYGNVARVQETGAYQGVSGKANRVTYQATSGFGQTVWSRTEGDDQAFNTTVARYAGTGELLDYWKGNLSNLTAFTYATSGADLGRATGVRSGVSGRDATSYTYDTYGRVKTASSAGGTTTYTYDTLDRVVTRTLPTGARETFSYDASGEIDTQVKTETTRSLKRTTTVTRDPLGRPLTIDDGLGIQTMTYDPAGRLIRLHDTHLDMNAAGEDQARYYAYDGLGRLTASIGPAMNTDAKLGAQNDTRRPMKRLAYNGRGQMTEQHMLVDGRVTAQDLYVTPAAQFKSTRLKYDAHGFVTEATGVNGLIMTVDTDASGQPIREVKKLKQGDAVSTFRYSAIGNTVQHTDPLGHVTSATYNELGQTVSVTDPNGNIKVGYTYTPDYLPDATYRPAPNAKATASAFTGSATTGMVKVQAYEYGTDTPYPTAVSRRNKNDLQRMPLITDSEGRVTTQTLPNGSKEEFTYDTWGNLLTSVNAAGLTTSLTYDAYERLTQRTATRERPEDISSGATSRTETFAYDKLNHLTESTNGQLHTRFAYNSQGKIIAETPEQRGDSLARVKYSAFRPDGLLVLQTAPGFNGTLPGTEQNPDAQTAPAIMAGQVSVFNRDAAGRLTVNASYGKNGREAITRYTYSELDHPLTRAFQGDSAVYAVQRDKSGVDLGTDLDSTFTYDLNGRLLTREDKAKDGTVVSAHTFTYTPTGKEKTRRTQHNFSGAYNLPSNPKRTEPLTLGAQDLSVQSTYGPSDQLTQAVTRSAGHTQKNTITYFDDGRRASVDGGPDGQVGRTTTYDYDWAGRTSSETVKNNATGRSETSVQTYSATGGYTKSIANRSRRDVTLNMRGQPQRVNIYVPGPEGKLVLGSEHLFRYDENGQEARQDVTQHYWYSSGKPGDVTYGSVQMTFDKTFNDEGQVTSETITVPKTFADKLKYCETISCTTSGENIKAVSGQWTYDGTGQIATEKVNRPAAFTSNRTVSYQRSASGLLTSSTGVYANNVTYSSKDGAVTRYTPEGAYGTIDRTYRTGDNRKVSARFGYDPYGQLTYSLNAIQREMVNKDQSVTYDMDRDLQEYAYAGTRRVAARSATSSQGNSSQWGRTATQTDQELFREDRWRDMTYAIPDGIGDDRISFSYHFEPRNFDLFPASTPAATQNAAPAPVTVATKTAPAPAALPAENGTVTPLGWGDPFQLTTTGAMPTSSAQGDPLSAQSAPQGVGPLEVPNSGLSSTLGLSPEQVQVPQNTALNTGGLPSDDLTFTSPISSQAGVPNPGGVLGVSAPDAPNLTPTLKPTELQPNPGPGPGSGLNGSGAGAGSGCGAGNNEGDGANPYPCADPYGDGPNLPDDPEDIDCPCQKAPSFKPKQAPPFATTVASATTEFFSDTLDGTLGLMGTIADGLNNIVQLTYIPAGEEIDTHMGTDFFQGLNYQLTGQTTFTAYKRYVERDVLSLNIDYCGRILQNAKKVIEIASWVIPETKLSLVGKARLPHLPKPKPLKEPYTPRAPKTPETPRGRPEEPEFGTGCPIPGANSFSGNTRVRVVRRDRSGHIVTILVPIKDVKVGDLVEGYDEISDRAGVYPVTALLKHIDDQITYLIIKSLNPSLPTSIITTTPEHPFFVANLIDAQSRPIPAGHSDLNRNWVGAGHLKIGDQIKQADGSNGVVQNVTTIQQMREMFNLTVSEAHTYFVSSNAALVHNLPEICFPVSAERQKELNNIMDQTGPYNPTQGHHIIPAANTYPLGQRGGTILDRMMTIPDAVIDPLMKVPHRGKGSLTSIMGKLERDLYRSGVKNTWEIQRELAYEGLVQAGMQPDMARTLVNAAYDDIVKLMPGGPLRTPTR